MINVGGWRLRSIVQRLQKLKGRSARELLERGGQMLTAELEHRNLASTVKEPSDRTLWSLLDSHAVSGSGESAARLHAHYATREFPTFFAGVRSGASARELGSPRWSIHRAHLMAAADRIVAGQFDLLGHDSLSFGSPIDWHFDPTTNRRAPRMHWSRIPYLDADLIGDHKVIWEINRHQHLVVLGRAYQATARPTYAACFAEHLASWLDANPPKNGVNWASSLEVAYRSISWLWALELFRGADSLNPALLQRTLKYLYLHGRHIERYLSTYFSPNTHLTGEALGLLYLGVLLPEFRRAATWRRLGWQILEEQLPRQVHPDGVYFEQASYYHRYTVDIYLHAFLLAGRAGIVVPSLMRERLALAAGHLADLTRSDGTIPVIGDDDGGQLVLVEERAFTDARSALGVASVVLGRPELAAVAGTATEEVLWLLGPDGVQALDTAISAPPPAHLSSFFPQGGYAIMRDSWGPSAMHAVIDCGPLGAMNCGHAHSDALSVVMSVGDSAVLVDPGTYTYTGSASDRDHFRHSAAHNTVTVDGQSASVPSGPFHWAYRTDARVEHWWSGALTDRFQGVHSGFERLPDPALHRRSLLFVRGEYWVILDSIVAAREHEATAHYHLALGSVAEPASDGSAWLLIPCADGFRRLLFATAGDTDSLAWGEDWVSPSYGSRARAPYARLTSRGTGRRDLISVFLPASDGEIVSVRELPTDQGRAVAVNRPAKHDLLLFETEGSVRVDGLEMAGDAALIRRASDGGALEAVALFGAKARLEIDGLTFQAEDAAEMVRTGSGWRVEGKGQVAVRS